MQFNLFLLGATLLFIVSQIGYASAACCADGWTRVNESCYYLFLPIKPLTSLQQKNACELWSATPVESAPEDPKSAISKYFDMVQLDKKFSWWKMRNICGKPI